MRALHKKIMRLIPVAALWTILVSLLPFAASAAGPGQSRHWLTQFGQEMETSLPKSNGNMQGKVKFVFGNNIWQPGHEFKDGDEWLALACSVEGCTLDAAALKVRKESWQGHYDDVAAAGQHLRFRTLVKSNAKVIAWFNTRNAPTWLKPGRIPTYYPGIGRPKSTGKGTLEVRIELPDGDTAMLVPMLLNPKWSPKLMEYFSPNDSGSSYLLQLRSRGKRQLLPAVMGTCSHGIGDQAYLLWAGDMDDDGKPDYLISFIDADGPVHLYLSSAAKPGQLVGIAGLHNSPPYGGECDGEEPEL